MVQRWPSVIRDTLPSSVGLLEVAYVVNKLLLCIELGAKAAHTRIDPDLLKSTFPQTFGIPCRVFLLRSLGKFTTIVRTTRPNLTTTELGNII